MHVIRCIYKVSYDVKRGLQVLAQYFDYCLARPGSINICNSNGTILANHSQFRKTYISFRENIYYNKSEKFLRISIRAE